MSGESIDGDGQRVERRRDTGIAPDSGGVVRAVRVILAVLGAVVVLIGAYEVQQTVSVQHIWGLLLWLLLALILHDGIIAPIVFVVTLVLRKTGRRIPVVVLAIVQAGVVVGLVFSIIVIPEIIKAHIGNPNPTVMPFDYAARLAVLWVVVAVVTALAVVIAVAVRRARPARSAASHPPHTSDSLPSPSDEDVV